jgi:hypothetical protein
MARYWVGGTASWDGTAGAKWATVSGGAGGAAEPTATDDVFFDGASGAVVVTVATSARPCRNLDFTGFTGTFTGTLGLDISGSLTMAAAATMTFSYTGPISFLATAAKTITSHGYVFGSTFLFNGAAGTWTLQDAFTTTDVVTHSRGTWNTNSKTTTVAGLILGSALTHTWALGNSLFEVTTSAGISTVSSTGLTVTTGGSSRIKFSGVTAPTIFQAGGFTFDDLEFSGGTDTLTVSVNPVFRDVFLTNPSATSVFAWTTNPTMRDFDCTGFAGTWGVGGANPKVTRDFILDAGMTVLFAGSMRFNGTVGTQQVTTNGVNCSTMSFIFGAFGAAFKINGNLTCGGFQHSAGAGALDASGITIVASAYNLGIAGVLDFTNSTVIATAATNAWINGSALLVTTGSEVILNNVSATNKTFNNAGGVAYNKVSFTGGGTGIFTVTGAFPIDTLTWAPGIHVSPGANTIRKLIAVGTALLPITVGGPAAIPPAFTCPANDVVCDYLILSNCAVGGGARWFAGRHSVNNGNNYGWRFTDPYRANACAMRPLAA